MNFIVRKYNINYVSLFNTAIEEYYASVNVFNKTDQSN